MKLIYRLLLVLSVAIALLAAGYAEITESTLPKESLEILALDGHGGIFDENSTVFESELGLYSLLAGIAILIIGSIIGWVAMFFFKAWGRTLTIVVSVITFITSGLMGITIMTAGVVVLNDLSTLLFGAVICMSFLPPISEEFKKTNQALNRTLELPPL